MRWRVIVVVRCEDAATLTEGLAAGVGGCADSPGLGGDSEGGADGDGRLGLQGVRDR